MTLFYKWVGEAEQIPLHLGVSFRFIDFYHRGKKDTLCVLVPFNLIIRFALKTFYRIKFPQFSRYETRDFFEYSQLLVKLDRLEVENFELKQKLKSKTDDT